MESQRTVYLAWKSPSRLFKKRDKEFFRNIAAIVFLLLVILFVAKEVFLILVVISIVFIVYVLATVPPEEIEHSISNKGIESAGREYKWDILKAFWFEEQWQQWVVVVTQENGNRLVLLLGEIDKDRVKEVLNKFLHFEEQPQKTIVDDAASWISKKIPLDKQQS